MHFGDVDFNRLIDFCIGRDGKDVVRNEKSALHPSDEAYLDKLVKAVRAGRPAIVIADTTDKVSFMFSNLSRAEAVMLLAKILEATGKRLADGQQ